MKCSDEHQLVHRSDTRIEGAQLVTDLSRSNEIFGEVVDSPSNRSAVRRGSSKFASPFLCRFIWILSIFILINFPRTEHELVSFGENRPFFHHYGEFLTCLEGSQHVYSNSTQRTIHEIIVYNLKKKKKSRNEPLMAAWFMPPTVPVESDPTLWRHKLPDHNNKQPLWLPLSQFCKLHKLNESLRLMRK